jgi:DHA1 family bicyclomycin/chloramphenicol resistance-like MFS transporter
MFAYIAGSTFVLQQIYQMSAQGFSVVFGVNALGIMAVGQIGGRLTTRWAPSRILCAGLLSNLAGSGALAATVLLGLPLPYLVGSLFVMVSAMGLVFPTAASLALEDHPHQAGTASSVLGLGQYVAGALVAPLVGIAGEDTAVPLGLVTLACSVSATGVFLGLAWPAIRRRGLHQKLAREEPGSQER